jgi:hypothetical protein
MSALLENIEMATKRFEGKGGRVTFTKARHYQNLATRNDKDTVISAIWSNMSYDEGWQFINFAAHRVQQGPTYLLLLATTAS